jgi:hypothetical protein
LVEFLKPYYSWWVAICDEYKIVVGFGKTLQEVTSNVQKQNRTDVILIAASKSYANFVTSV